MESGDNILELLRKTVAEAARKAKYGLILQPGAIGDCVLTLPLAGFMKDCLGLDAVDIIGHTEYIGILPGRTCADGIRSIDSLDLHRLFAEAKTFDLADGDPLINAFANYAWIVTFLGEPNSNFEQNLIFTANCSHSAEVIALPMRAPKTLSTHITDFYMEQFAMQSGLDVEPPRTRPEAVLIKATEADVNKGTRLLKETGITHTEQIVVIHPGSGGPDKCWHLENFLAVARELGRRGKKVIFLLGPAELERFGERAIRQMTSIANCLTGLSLAQVLGLLSCAEMFVGNDSGITHLAAGLGVRTVAIFGPTDPNVYRPIGPEVTIFTSSTRNFAKKPSVRAQHKVLNVLISQC